MALNNQSGWPRLTRTGNPGLNTNTFNGLSRPVALDERMTLQGTINKSFLLLVVLLAAAFWTWSQYLTTGNAATVAVPMMVGLFAGLVLALIISFKPTTAPYLSIPYAACEGLMLGGFSAELERRYPGIAIQAVGLTFGVLAAMLIAYKTGLIKVTQRFMMIVFAGTAAIGLMYLAIVVLQLFHVPGPTQFLWSGSPLNLTLSVVIMVFAALNLVMDFAMVESGVAQGAPRYMEWYSAFGLLVTLVWLYLEILRFLASIRSR